MDILKIWGTIMTICEEVPKVVDNIARFLAFFAATRTYRPLDKLARPFSIEDVVSTIQEALREVDVSYKNASRIEKKVIKEQEVELRYIEDPRVGEVEVPRLPKADTIKRFYALCKENLMFAKMAAALALSYGPMLIKGE